MFSSSKSRKFLRFDGKSCTKQEFKDDVDVNNIIRKYMRSGINPFVVEASARYLDISGIPTFHEAMNVVAQANATFSLLPSSLRKRFSNDPGQYIAFLSDKVNRDEAIKLGLVNAPTDAPSAPVEPVVTPSVG